MKASNPMATDKVIEYIKDCILTGKWKSGDRLPAEPELCAQVGVSRSCVREAMKVLNSSNIVDIRRGDGTYISNPDDISFMSPLLFKIILQKNTLKELYDFRESIELAVMRLAICNAEPCDIENLEACNHRMQEFIDLEKSDAAELYQIDLDFHGYLASATHNTIMRDVYQFTFDMFAPFIRRNYENGQNAESALETHLDIMSALKTGDLLRIGYAIRSSVSLWSSWISQKDASKIVFTDLWNTAQ